MLMYHILLVVQILKMNSGIKWEMLMIVHQKVILE